MRKLINLIISLVFVISTLSISVFASGEIIDEANVLGAESLVLLQDEIAFISANYAYDITFVTSEFENKEKSDEFLENYSVSDKTGNGVVFLLNLYQDYYNFKIVPYGQFSDTLTDDILEVFTNLDATTGTYGESLEYFLILTELHIVGTDVSVEYGLVPEEEQILGGDSEEPSYSNYFISGFNSIIDEADLFTAEEEGILDARMQEIHKKYDFDITFMTVKSVPNDDTLRSYLDFYEGLDPTRDGLIFGVSIEEGNREFSTSARNFGSEAYTDDAIRFIGSEIPPFLTAGEYFKAFNLYLDYAEQFLETAKAGKPYKAPFEISDELLGSIMFSMIIALIAAKLIVKYVYVADMKTAITKTEAKDFANPNSLELTESYQNYSHTTTTRTKIEKDSGGSSGSSSGGSSSSEGYGGSRTGGSGSF